MGKTDRVKKEKTKELEEELIKVKKENTSLKCENDFLEKELAKLRKEMGAEKCSLLNVISDSREAIEELEDRLKFVEQIHNLQVKESSKLKEKNKELEEKLKLFDEINTRNEE